MCLPFFFFFFSGNVKKNNVTLFTKFDMSVIFSSGSKYVACVADALNLLYIASAN